MKIRADRFGVVSRPRASSRGSCCPPELAMRLHGVMPLETALSSAAASMGLAAGWRQAKAAPPPPPLGAQHPPVPPHAHARAGLQQDCEGNGGRGEEAQAHGAVRSRDRARQQRQAGGGGAGRWGGRAGARGHGRVGCFRSQRTSRTCFLLRTRPAGRPGRDCHGSCIPRRAQWRRADGCCRRRRRGEKAAGGEVWGGGRRRQHRRAAGPRQDEGAAREVRGLRHE
jgi:hypothetical protein